MESHRDDIKSNRRQFNLGLSSLLFAAPVALSPQQAHATQPAPIRIGEERPELECFLQKRLRKSDVPGGSFAILQQGQIVWGWSYGMADVSTGAASDLDRIFCIGSITKSVSALLMLRLGYEGLVDLDVDISDYLGYSVRNPYFPDDTITIRQILTHASSMQDGDFVEYEKSYRLGAPSETEADSFVRMLYGSKKDNSSIGFWGRYAPGEATVYCNSAFGLLTTIVRNVTGRSYSNYLESEILEPAGFHNSSIDATHFARKRFMTPYGYKVDGKAHPNSFDVLPSLVTDEQALSASYTGLVAYNPIYTFASYADGALRMSGQDLFRLAQLYVNRGTLDGYEIVPPDVFQQMITVRSHMRETGFGMGAGLIRKQWGLNRHAWTFGGHEMGSKSWLSIDYETQIAVALNVNGTSFSDDDLYFSFLAQAAKSVGLK